MPSSDAAADARHFSGGFGAEMVFAIEAFETRVAMVRLDPHSPPLLFAEHLEGERPVLVYRVDDLDATITELRERGVEVVARFELPHGPGAELASPGLQRIALYQLTRPEADRRLAGRRDFE